MKKKQKKKKGEKKQKRPEAPSLSPSYTWLVANIIVWVFIGLLWIAWKTASGPEITYPGKAGFCFLPVYCLGFGFSIVSLLDLIWHR